MADYQEAQLMLSLIDRLIVESNAENFGNLVTNMCFYVRVVQFLENEKPIELSEITDNYNTIFCVEDGRVEKRNCFNFLFLKKRDGIIYNSIFYFTDESKDSHDGIVDEKVLNHAVSKLNLTEINAIGVPLVSDEKGQAFDNPIDRFHYGWYFFISFFLRLGYKNANYYSNTTLDKDQLLRHRGHFQQIVNEGRLKGEFKKEMKMATANAIPKIEKEWRISLGVCLLCGDEHRSQIVSICENCCELMSRLLREKTFEPRMPDYSKAMEMKEFNRHYKMEQRISCSFCKTRTYKHKRMNSLVKMCAYCVTKCDICSISTDRVIEPVAILHMDRMAKILHIFGKMVEERLVEGNSVKEALVLIGALDPEGLTNLKAKYGHFHTYLVPTTAMMMTILMNHYYIWLNNQSKKPDEAKTVVKYHLTQESVFKKLHDTLLKNQFDILSCFSPHARDRRLQMLALFSVQD